MIIRILTGIDTTPNGIEVLPPKHVGEEGWPTLGEVIEAAFELGNQLGAKGDG